MNRVSGMTLIRLRRREAEERWPTRQYHRGLVYDGRSWMFWRWLLFIGQEIYAMPEERTRS